MPRPVAVHTCHPELQSRAAAGAWPRPGPDLAQTWPRPGPDLAQTWPRLGPDLPPRPAVVGPAALAPFFLGVTRKRPPPIGTLAHTLHTNARTRPRRLQYPPLATR